MSETAPDPTIDFLPPELPRPHQLRKRDGKKRTRRRLTIDTIDRFCRALESLPFERKAADACGIAWATLMRWKQTGRAYLQYLDEKGIDPDQRHVDYICLYLVAKVERVLAKKKAALLGTIASDPDWRAKRYILSVIDRDFAERRRQDWGLDLGTESELDQDESRSATELRITIVKSRPEPDDMKEGEAYGADVTGDTEAPDNEN